MSEDSELNSRFLRGVYQRLSGGDRNAQNELLVRVQARLERLVRKMLHGFPTVRRWEDTADVLQNSTLRLLRSIEEVRPDSERAFFGLAAENIRRVLLDLARHYQGAHGIGANHASVADRLGRSEDRDGQQVLPTEPAAPDPSAAELDRWCAFHQAIEQLPTEEREVIGLCFYHGWKHSEIAALFQVHERTVRRYWQSACLKLNELLKGELPIR